MTWVTSTLAQEIGYDAYEDGSVDDLIAYKDELEGIVNRIDAVMTANARGDISGADATGALFDMGFGNLTRKEWIGD